VGGLSGRQRVEWCQTICALIGRTVELRALARRISSP